MKKIIATINSFAGVTVTWVSLGSICGVGRLAYDVSRMGLTSYIQGHPYRFVLGCLSLGTLFMAVLMVWFFKVVLKRVTNNGMDYKVVCRKLPQELASELANKDLASPYVDEAQAGFCETLDQKGFVDLLNSRDVDCINIKSGSKKGKTIMQCSFIPVDADRNTIIIRRRPENHFSIFKKISSWFKNINAFVSFSPIPDGHNRTFESIARCYAHEVPSDGAPLSDSDFEFVGVIYNRRGGGKRVKSFFPWRRSKERAKLDECIRYLFVVYVVHYKGLHFSKNGRPNWSDIDLAFSPKPLRGSRGKDRFFLKDHDPIVGVDSVVELGSRLSTNGSEESRRWMKVEQEALRRAKGMIVMSLQRGDVLLK